MRESKASPPAICFGRVKWLDDGHTPSRQGKCPCPAEAQGCASSHARAPWLLSHAKERGGPGDSCSPQ